MAIKIIFICINLLLIYNSNGFSVDDYAAARQNVKELEEYEEFKSLKSHLADIKITYNTGDIELVYGYVNENSVTILNNFIHNDIQYSIIKISYTYNKKLITMSDLQIQKNSSGRKTYISSIVSSNKSEIKNIDYNILFLSDSTVYNILRSVLKIKNHTIVELNQLLHTLKLGETNDFINEGDSDGTFNFCSINLSDKWYIYGKVNGSSKNELISTSYISESFNLRNILKIKGEQALSIPFLSLNEKKFNQDDVGAYLIYLTALDGPKVFAQITKVVTKGNVQILYIQKLSNRFKIHIKYKYSKIESTPIEDGYTLTSLSSPSSKVEEDKQQELTQSESNDSGILQETIDELPAAKKSKPNVEDIVIELENFTCGSIITKGEYILKSRNITINVTEEVIDDYFSNSSSGNLYKIKGYYTYNSVTKYFTACHSSDDAKWHDDYLVTNEEDGGIDFYPNHIVANKH